MKKSDWDKEVDKLVAETHAMIKPSGRFFDEVEISFFDGYMYFKLDKDIYRIKLVPTGYLKKLYHATKKQRENYELDPSRYGVHWEDLDEDLSFKGLIKDAEKISNQKRKQTSKLKIKAI